MRTDFLRSATIALALLCSPCLAVAQTPAPKEPEQQSQSDKAQHSPSGKSGKEEPSANAPTVKPQDTAVLVNGALAVPDAPANTDTVPAKFSAKNAADDELITIAYTLKHLTEAERDAIHRALRQDTTDRSLRDRPTGSAATADVGTELPFATALNAMPEALVVQLPQIREYRYIVAGDRVMLVAPANRIVVAVIPAQESATTGARREPQ
jgi:hypothetical protein